MRLDVDTLDKVGNALFGPNWQTPLAKELAVNLRTMQRWASAETPMPERIWAEIGEICRQRSEALANWAGRLEGKERR